MINEFLSPKIQDIGVTLLWFQQDGATCHKANDLIALFKETSDENIISRDGPVYWPPKILMQFIFNLFKFLYSGRASLNQSAEQRNLNPYAFLVLFYICNRKLRIPSITWAKIQLIWNVQKGVLELLIRDKFSLLFSFKKVTSY